MTKKSKYTTLRSFSDGFAWAQRDGKWGLINKSGEEVIECKFTGGMGFSSIGYAAMTDPSGCLCIIDRADNCLFKYSYAELLEPTDDPYYAKYLQRLIHLFDYHPLIAYKTDKPLDKGWTLVNFRNENKVIGHFADINTDCSCINGLIPVMDFSGKWGVIDETGEWIIPAIYDHISYMPEGYSLDYFSVLADGKFGLISSKGDTVLDNIYHDLVHFSEKCILIRNGKKYGIITQDGEIVIQCKYDDIFIDESENVIAVKKKGLWGLTDMHGKMLVKPAFNIGDKSRLSFHDGLARVYGTIGTKMKIGFVNPSGEMEIPFKFNHPVHNFSEGMAAFYKKSNRKKGWIDKTGNVVIPQIYNTSNSSFHEGYVPVQYNREWFYIDKTGTRCIL